MKDFKTYQEQINILESRGMVVNDRQFALEKLKTENYYNIINGYKDLFVDQTHYNERYKIGTQFEEIYALFDFDRILKNILMGYIVQIEDTLRSLIAYTFSEKYGHDNYLKYSNFDVLSISFSKHIDVADRGKKIHQLITNLSNDIAGSIDKKDYIKHYIVEYGYVPLWVLVNCVTLGRLSQFYQLMKQPERINVAMHWNVKESDLKQYVKVLAHYRNLCAHGERIYNSKTGLNIPNTMHHNQLNIPLNNGNYICGLNDLFSLIIVLKVLLPKEGFNIMCNKICGRLKSLEQKLTTISINEIYNKMGLPHNWIQIKH